MAKATSVLCGVTILAAGLAVCLAKPADILAQVPSSYYYGNKWVLFRDDNVPDPPHNVIQADDTVQVLPAYRHQQQIYHQQPQYQESSFNYAQPDSVHVTAAPVHVQSARYSVQSTSYSVTPAPIHVQPTSYSVTPAPIHVQPTSFHVTPAPVHLRSHAFHHVTPAPVHAQPAPVHAQSQFDTDIVHAVQDHFQQQHEQQQHHQQQYQQHYVKHNPLVKIGNFAVTPLPVTAVPHAAVHVDSPTYIDFLRKKKSA